MASIIAVIIGLVTLVVGLVIVDNVIKDQTWNSSLSTTISKYVVPIALLGALALGASIASYVR